MSRESVAKIELDKAEARLRKNDDLARQLAELFKDMANDANMSLGSFERYVDINGKRYTEADLKKKLILGQLFQDYQKQHWVV